jgi:beta-carotene/zeaxanthin 4-ketolase
MGIFIAVLIIWCWASHQVYMLLMQPVNLLDVWFWVNMFIQSWLFTGLFITAHDSMHGTISRNAKVNNFLGFLSTLLFAGMWYPNLLKKHKLHHIYSATMLDPDYHEGNQNFFVWWFSFMKQYVTWWQMLIMAGLFNLGLLSFTELQLLVLWILPSILATFQLFYFGTYVPHHLPHTSEMGIHKARSQKRNHLWAMVSCYFFGYHYEHHVSPQTPWWKLHQLKTK